MIRKLLVTSALVAVPFMAEAADLAVKAPPRAPAPLEFSWAGWYIGGTAGYGEMGLRTPEGDASAKHSGVVGGLHAGRNWESGNIVYGIEGDIGATAIAGHIASTGSSTSTSFSSHLTATLRGRLGIAFNRNLLYATGGASYLHGRIHTDDNNSETTRHNIWGYVVGGGWEHAYNNSLILRVEGLYHGYNKTLNYACNSGCESMRIKDIWTVRAGFSYKF
jgi:outer membrane immunogenic protein